MPPGPKRRKTKASTTRAGRRPPAPNGRPTRSPLATRLAEALDQQAATVEILRLISSAPADTQPIFDAIVQSAARLCQAQRCHVFRLEGDRLHFVAHHGLTPEGIEAVREAWPQAPRRRTAAGRAFLANAVVQIPDVHADPEYALRSVATIAAYRSTVGVPIQRDGRPIGAITVSRAEVGALPDRQVALLQTFADQAVIAIENVRLFTELEVRNADLRVALEQQTATSEVLKVIGGSTFDLQPVFETLAENAIRLCAADRALIFRFDGQVMRVVADNNISPELLAYHDQHPIPPGRGSCVGRVALERRTIHIHDVRTDPEYTFGGTQIDPYRTLIGVPMLRAGELLGAINIVRYEVRPFTESQVALMETFADQAAIAIENARLLGELQARNADLTETLEQQTATSEILRVISRSPTDVQPVFDTIVQNVVRLCDGRHAAVFRFDGTLVHLAAHHNVTAEALEEFERVYPVAPSRQSLSARAILDRAVVHVPDVDGDVDAGSSRLLGRATGYRSVLSIPMLRDGTPIGAISVGRAQVGPFGDRQIELVKTFAEQGADGTNLDAFRRAAHSLKSNCETLGATDLAARARELETMARAGRVDGVAARVEQLGERYEGVVRALGEIRRGLTA